MDKTLFYVISYNRNSFPFRLICIPVHLMDDQILQKFDKVFNLKNEDNLLLREFIQLTDDHPDTYDYLFNVDIFDEDDNIDDKLPEWFKKSHYHYDLHFKL